MDNSSKLEVIKDLRVCVDCLFALANGDYPEDEARAAAIVAGEQRELPLRWVIDGDHEDEFSWSACDCCNSSLGGSRHGAALIGVAS